MRLSVRLIEGWSGPRAGLAAALAGADGVVLSGRWAGGGAVVAADPVEVVTDAADPFEVLDVLSAAGAVPGTPEAAIGGGWFGYLGFEAGSEPLVTALRARQRPAVAQTATSYWALYPNVVRYEAATGRWFDEALVGLIEDAELERRRRALVSLVAGGGASSFRPTVGPLRTATSLDAHVSAVRAAQDHIAAGDIYQVNLCLPLTAERFAGPDTAFDVLASELEPEYGAFVSGGFGAGGAAAAVVSASPELFLRRRGREVVSAPIKGTRPRPDDAVAAAVQARELLSSVKERAENVMITDLIRNDLSRVAAVGSVRVPALLRLEPHPGVWHLVSEVSASLPAEVTDAALLRAMFPPGSVTGAPKIRALEVIAELEQQRRGVYTGAIGYVSPAFGLELNVAIRTLVVAGGAAELSVGGGVTAGSVPMDEWWECFDKARAIAVSLRADVDVPGSRRP